jgi:hypothetical protein
LHISEPVHSLSGSVRLVTGAQLPSVAPVFSLLQAWQVAPHAVPQQTPSTQKLLWHWFAAVQPSPFALFATHSLLLLQ